MQRPWIFLAGFIEVGFQPAVVPIESLESFPSEIQTDMLRA